MKKRRNRQAIDLKPGFFSNSKRVLIALLVIAAAAVTYTIANGAIVSHPPRDIQPQGAGSGLDADKLQGLSSADLLAAGGGVGSSPQMPLQGVINYPTGTATITNIPLALPKIGCTVKITACTGTSSAAPPYLIIGANPVARILKSSTDVPPTAQNSQRITSSAVYFATTSTMRVGYNVYCYSYEGGDSCYNPDGSYYVCASGFISRAGENICDTTYGYNTCSDNLVTSACVKCPADHPSWDYATQSCYDPSVQRCPSALASEVFIKYVFTEHSCIYCPTDHPIYDATAKSCIKSATVSTTPLSNCAVFTTILDASSTDITFLKDTAPTYTNVNYATVAYTCPQ